MSVVVITPPASPAVSYEECKAHLRLNDDYDQTYVEALSAAAEQHLAGPDGWLGRSIGMQTLELRACGFGPRCLPYGPVRSVVSVTYEDDEGGEQTVGSSTYRASGLDTVTAAIGLASGQAWPSVSSEPDRVRVRYTAGYEPADVPPALKHAILLLVSHWYEHREAVSADQTYEVSLAVQALASPFRVWAV